MNINDLIVFKDKIRENKLIRKYLQSYDMAEKVHALNLDCIDAFEIDLDFNKGIQSCNLMIDALEVWKKHIVKYRLSLNAVLGFDIGKHKELITPSPVYAALHPDYLKMRTGYDIKRLAMLYIHWKKKLNIIWNFLQTPAKQITEEMYQSVYEAIIFIYNVCKKIQMILMSLEKKISIYKRSIIQHIDNELGVD